MASAWWMFGRSASSSSTVLSLAKLLELSKANIERISYLTLSGILEEPLNPYQCRSMAFKLVKIMKNIEVIANALEASSPAFENFFQITRRARELIEDCCNPDWCLASTFQIHNEEAFKEILLETSLCYYVIYELAKDINNNELSFEDLRFSSTFDPPTSAEVFQDQMILMKRYKDFVDVANVSRSFNRRQYLANYLLRRMNCFPSKSNIDSKSFGVCDLKLWPNGNNPDDEWGKESIFLGGCVCKTTWLDVPCAQKIFKDGVPEDDILAEARILASLNHPNIVKFICCGHDNKNKWHFIAMEQMETGLHSVIKTQAELRKGVPFSLSSAIDIMLQIAYGTCYLHENGIAHRDLKTCNVVVRQVITPHLQDYFQVKLVDFGLSKVNLSVSKSNTISYPKTGTTVYMPPEAFQHGRANWFKADAYSFGIMCSVILSGKEPFQNIQRNKIYEAISKGERPQLPQDIPYNLSSLIKKCWDLDRHLRPNFVEICIWLAKIKYYLLKEDPICYSFNHEIDNIPNLYIQERIQKRSLSRKNVYCFNACSKETSSSSSKSKQNTDHLTDCKTQQHILGKFSMQHDWANVMQQQQTPPQLQLPFSPVAIFWDIEVCLVLEEMKVGDVVGNIMIALREYLHFGVVTTFSAYGDFNHFPKKFREGCHRWGVNLIDVPNGEKDIVDKAILVDMFLFALDNPPPSTIFLITGNVDFGPALHKLNNRGYVVVLVVPTETKVPSALRGVGRFVYDWSCLCRGKGLTIR